jgi:glyoxylase-like metal-dependent hydrolase (beta-lactamase superfamily II)
MDDGLRRDDWNRSPGRLNDPCAVRSLRIDDVVATYVVDGVLSVRPVELLPKVPAGHWSTAGLLDAHARIVMSVGGLLIERDGRALLIDAGAGPTSGRSVVGPVTSGAMLDVLGSLGRRREDIEVLAFTHLHFDHTGWAFTHGTDGRATKTFPDARYMVSAPEWAPYEHGAKAGVATSRDLIAPLAACRTEFEDGDEIFPGVRAVVTPGHSAGHTSYVITSATTGQRLVAFGDAFHIPAQLAHPDWSSAPDTDVQAVKTARRRLLAELTAPNTIGFAFHFGDQPFGRVTTDAGVPSWEPIATTVQASAPRRFT